MKLSDIHKPGIDIAHYRILQDPVRGGPFYLASSLRVPRYREDLIAFQRRHRRKAAFLPSRPSNAFDALKVLQPQVTPIGISKSPINCASRLKIGRRKCCCAI